VIIVSLRTAASAEAPSTPMALYPRLHGKGGGSESASVSMGVDRKANTQGAAHSRYRICVVLRMAASAEAPSSPIVFARRLRARGRGVVMRESTAADGKASTEEPIRGYSQ